MTGFCSKKVLLFGRFFQCCNLARICATGPMNQPCFGIGNGAASRCANCSGDSHGFLSRIGNGIKNHLIDFFGHLILVWRILCFEFVSFHKIIKIGHFKKYSIQHSFPGVNLSYRKITRFCFACHTTPVCCLSVNYTTKRFIGQLLFQRFSTILSINP